MLEKGTVIDNRFEVIEVIGVGGYGTVVKARQLNFDRLVAIKLLKTDLLNESDGLPRFEREARAINGLQHKNIVAFYGFGAWDNAPYMVMELIEGVSLEKLLIAERLTPERTLNLFSEVFSALGYAHHQGLIHRDLKPSNIMIMKDAQGTEHVKLIDFGLVKLMPGYGFAGQKLTETGYALGTCHYMAPEQALGMQVDQRVDIYAAGCILQQALTNELPFDADNNVAIMFKHINNPPPQIAEKLGQGKSISALQILIDNCIAKDPSERYQNCADAVRDIALLQSGQHAAVLRLNSGCRGRTVRSVPKWRYAATLAAAVAGAIAVYALWRPACHRTTTSTEQIGQHESYSKPMPSENLGLKFDQDELKTEYSDLMKKGHQEANAGNYDAAIKFFTQAQKDQTHVAAGISPLIAIAQTEFRRGRFEEAAIYAVKALEWNCKEPNITVRIPAARLCLLKIPASADRKDREEVEWVINDLYKAISDPPMEERPCLDSEFVVVASNHLQEAGWNDLKVKLSLLSIMARSESGKASKAR